MAAVLDIIGSSIIGGLLILTMLRMNAAGMENQSYFSEDLLVQENLREMTKVIESDFRKIGYRIPPDNNGNIRMDQIFVSGDTTQVVFRSDIYRSGNPVNIQYQLGGYVTSTPNDSDRYLWRKVGNEPRQNIASGMIRFRLRYLERDSLKVISTITPANVDEIGSVEVTIELQSPYVVRRYGQSMQESYEETTTLWRQTRLIARNLNR